MARILDTFPDPAYDPPADTVGAQTIILGGGCFWCTEGVFQQMPGVTGIVSGYAGGSAKTANYRDVCDGNTNHAEVIAITYDPQKVSLGQILKTFFWLAHDPTQLNGQGADIGTQYRSAIFYADEHQHAVASRYIAQLNDANVYGQPIVTTLEPLNEFYEAEAYHQNYAALNPGQGYIRAVAQPKIDRTRAAFAHSTVKSVAS